ncbi:MAG: carbamoyl-phosphate synthase large subunit [Proteobacteria bacterium]|nr:carbamoyl-phosphate synthase large subunit [Pseudomonadota bacterium]
MKILVANRGEIALRIMRAAAEMSIETTGVYSEDDAGSLHRLRADHACPLEGRGALAYLDSDQMIDVALKNGCDAIHPGYGFLSENVTFAEKCHERGITFIGPSVDTLAKLGDKAKARSLAVECGVPILKGTNGAVDLDGAGAFFASLPDRHSVMIKAVSGGGGRGMRIVDKMDALEDAFNRCQSEALQAFGNNALYLEEYLKKIRHIEVQIVGDGKGNVRHLGERECSIQRQHQKLIEIAPSPSLSRLLREKICGDAVRMASALHYKNLGTFEFLVSSDFEGDSTSYAFIEANPRLQVEHTITEEVMDVDLVKCQINIARGKSLAELGLDLSVEIKPQGYAIEVRINMETMDDNGYAIPVSGRLKAFEVPSGRGVRVDTFGYSGYQVSPYYDSLLAKLICHSRSEQFADVLKRTYRALCEFRIEGIPTNIPFLQNILTHPDFSAQKIHTVFVDDHLKVLTPDASAPHQSLFYNEKTRQVTKPDANDPLAVLDYGKTSDTAATGFEGGQEYGDILPSHMENKDDPGVLKAAMQGVIVSIDVKNGDSVKTGQQVIVMNAMKMEHVIKAKSNGVIKGIVVSEGDIVMPGQPMVYLEINASLKEAEASSDRIDLTMIRADLKEVEDRHDILLDAARPEAVEKRRKLGLRTARENIEDLCDEGSFIEYGGLIVAARRRTQAMEELIRKTPADGLVTGLGQVNRSYFNDEKSRCLVMSYDYTVLAGTQGMNNHDKKDRMFELAEKHRIPLVIFAEGGGGRPGDTDMNVVAGLNVMAFHLYAKLSGLVPLVGICTGRCFAGNAALLGCSDVVIATRQSSIGMGGPAMIEGGGLGIVKPDEVGPMQIQVKNGVVDILVADDVEAVSVAKNYLSYFQGALDTWESSDQRLLRHIIPENRLRVYDIREVIETLADTGSVLELRQYFGPGMVTAFMRIEGKPFGVIANNPKYLSGAIDSPAADKAARFMQLCDTFDIPVLFLCDTPGIMVGPEIEKTALVRHCCRLFVNGANLTVPFFTIVIRKAYGLGAMAMMGGSSKRPAFTVSWPTGEFGGMGLEGAVKLGFRKQLEAIEDPKARKEMFEGMVKMAYEYGKALNTASYFEIDDVIDPAESRRWIMSGLRSLPSPPARTHKKRPFIDTW